MTTPSTISSDNLQGAAGAGRDRVSGRVRTASPWLLFGASLAAVVLGSVLFVRNRQVPGTGRFFDPVMPGVGLAYPAVGAFILSRRPSNRIGWLYCTGALLGVAFVAEQYAVHALLAEPGSLPGGAWAAWLAGWLRIPSHLLPWTLLLLLYPDGRPPGPRWRALAPVAAAAVAAATALAAFAPAGVDSPVLRNPVALDIGPRLSGALQAVCVLGFGPLCLAALLVRLRRLDELRRAQLRPFVAAATVVVVVPLSAAVAVRRDCLCLWAPIRRSVSSPSWAFRRPRCLPSSGTASTD